MKAAIAVVLSLLSASSWAQMDIPAKEVFLCMDENGKKYYANTGATKGCKKVELPAVTMIPPPPQSRIDNAQIGMSKAAVLKAVGKPSATRKVETRAGMTERWTYPGGKTLTFHNGILEMIEK